MLIGLLRLSGIVALIPSAIAFAIAMFSLPVGMQSGMFGGMFLLSLAITAGALLAASAGGLLLAAARHLEQQDQMLEMLRRTSNNYGAGPGTSAAATAPRRPAPDPFASERFLDPNFNPERACEKCSNIACIVNNKCRKCGHVQLRAT